MSDVDWSKAPDGAEFYVCGKFYKNKDGLKWFSYMDETWYSSLYTVDKMLKSDSYQPRPQQWPETDERIDNIGRNRTDDDMGHYNAPERTTSDESAKPKSKYHRIIKGVEIDLYDVLKAYGVTCPALAHAIKKAMLPGARHAKSFEQDIDEAIASLERAKELANE